MRVDLLQQLSAHLRLPLPEEMTWDFEHVCSIDDDRFHTFRGGAEALATTISAFTKAGLCRDILFQEDTDEAYLHMADVLEIPVSDVWRMFVTSPSFHDWPSTTPKQVADVIDEWLLENAVDTPVLLRATSLRDSSIG